MIKPVLNSGIKGMTVLKYTTISCVPAFRIIILAISVFIPTCKLSYSQYNNLIFRQITEVNGLPNNHIRCIVQDKKGYIWFGTENGLAKYDGYESTIYRKMIKDSTSLTDNCIYKLFVDSRGRLWVGTNGGLNLYDENRDRFISYFPVKNRIELNTQSRISGIGENRNHDIYAISESGMLYLVKNNSLVLERDLSEYMNTRPLLIDSDDILWIGIKRGLIRYDLNKNKAISFPVYTIDGKTKPFGPVRSLFENGDSLLVGTNSGELVLISKSKLTSGLIKFSNPVEFNQQNLNVTKIIKLKSGNICLGTNNGLVILGNKNVENKFISVTTDPSELNSNIINDIIEDKQGNLWIGTPNGVSFAMMSKQFNNYSINNQNLKIDIKGVHALWIDSKGNMLVGSYENGLEIINLKSGTRRLYKPSTKIKNSISPGCVNFIYEDRNKNIWTSTYYGYLSKFNPKNGKFASFRFNNLYNGFKYVTDIRSMTEDKKGNLWFLSHGFGLFKYNPKTNKIKYFAKNFKDTDHSLADNYAFQITPENDSIYWIATASGLSRFNIITEKFRSYFNNPLDSLTISNEQVNSVFCDSYKNIWIGTAFGLDLYDRKKDNFIHFHTDEGLPDNQIQSILEQEPGIIWMGTKNGLSRMTFTIDQNTGIIKPHFKNFDRSDNLDEVLFMQNSACKSKNGELFFGSDKGMVSFYPDKITTNTAVPDLVITDLFLFNKKVHIGDADSVLRRNIINSDKITLRHNQNFITLKYSAINYIAPEKSQYAYKLEGLETEWNNVGTRRVATYTNLPPGKYRFIVKASNNDGIWNEAGKSIQILITYPWWQTWWFKGILSLAIIGLLLLIYYIRVAFYRRQKRKLQILVKERTTQLEEVASSLQEKQEEINAQHEILIKQKDKLEKANLELYKHRTQLESLVVERTQELVKAKEKAEESDRLKSSFLTNLSHEIRTPLNAILGFSSLITQDDSTAEERIKYNSIIQSSNDTLLDLINDILDISRIESGQISILLSELDITDIVNDAKKSFYRFRSRQFTDYDKDVDLIVNLNSELGNYKIVANRKRLEQVISNLLGNALKYSDKGSVEFGCRKKSDSMMIEFWVKDNGIGIKEKDLKIIFERFRKIEDEKSQVHRGAGLGLAISSHLIKLQGGDIWVESEYGKGSVFHFDIPCIASTVTESKVEQVISSGTIPDFENCEILVAEDDQANFNYLEILLKKTGARIHHAENGKEVINILLNNSGIKLVLMDIKMPVMDGTEALREMRKMKIEIPVIAQSAYALADEVTRLRSEGFNEYITKPVKPTDLYNAIRMYLIKEVGEIPGNKYQKSEGAE